MKKTHMNYAELHYNKRKTPEFNERQAFENERVSPLTNDKTVNLISLKERKLLLF